MSFDNLFINILTLKWSRTHHKIVLNPIIISNIQLDSEYKILYDSASVIMDVLTFNVYNMKQSC